ncbi:MAG: hypothetical protein ABJC33_11900 [Betaproteobacteria bacterium]
MSSAPLPSFAHPAQAALLEQLARVGRLHAERQANPIVAGALERIARWQARRLRLTYTDVAMLSRYTAAIRFFENDLYGNVDFAKRDADLARVVPLMVRMLPEKVIATVAQAVELNALSHELDGALLTRLPRPDGIFTVADYCKAYRRMDQRMDRERQIRLLAEVGAALDSHVDKPLVRSALAMMRRPARLAGFSALHDFLDRGFKAFRAMHGAQTFLATIVARETALMDRILAGDTAPFPDPLVHAGITGSPSLRTPVPGVPGS